MRVLNFFRPFLSHAGVTVFKCEQVLLKHDVTRVSNMMLWADNHGGKIAEHSIEK